MLAAIDERNLIPHSEHAIILDQVENGVAIRMTIIYLLASKLNTNIK